MGEVTLIDMLLHGLPVLSVLLLMSIFSVALIFERLDTLRSMKPQVANLEAHLIELVDKGHLAEAYKLCGRQRPGPERVYARLLQLPPNREIMEKELWAAVQETIQQMEGNASYLGTVASTAPFVGLFGTVVGVIRAFLDISSAGGGGFEVVSVGIAEALVATATGLLVAIPAVIAFNYISSRVQKAATQMEVTGQRIINRLLPVADDAARAQEGAQ